MKLRTCYFLLFLSFKSSWVYADKSSIIYTKESPIYISFLKDLSAGIGLLILLNIVHEAGHAFANYLTGGNLIAINVGSQSAGNKKPYISVGKLNITGFGPHAAHIIREFKKQSYDEKYILQREIFIDYAGPLAAIAGAGLSLYAFNRCGITSEDYPIMYTVASGLALGNIFQLLPFTVNGTKSDGMKAYESYQKLKKVMKN